MAPPVHTTLKRYQVWSYYRQGVPTHVIAKKLRITQQAVQQRLHGLRQAMGMKATLQLLHVEFVVGKPESQGDALRPLTARQTEILRLVASGLRHADISKDLGISKETIKRHMQDIYEKLGMSNAVEVTLWLIEQNKKEQA